MCLYWIVLLDNNNNNNKTKQAENKKIFFERLYEVVFPIFIQKYNDKKHDAGGLRRKLRKTMTYITAGDQTRFSKCIFCNLNRSWIKYDLDVAEVLFKSYLKIRCWPSLQLGTK